MAASLTDRTRRALQVIYDHFRATASWAKVESLQRDLFRLNDSFDLYAAVENIPAELVRQGWDPGGEVSLTLRGIRACTGSADDFENVMHLVRLALERYKGPEDEPTIGGNDLKGLGLDDLAIARVLKIADSEAYLLGGGSGSGSTWTRFVSPQIRHFGHVESIEQYLATRDALERKVHVAAAPGSFADVDLGGTPRPAAAPATTLYVDQRLVELDDLATTTLKRFEGGDALSAVLPLVHRLASELGDLEIAQWTRMEIEGLSSGLRPRSELQDAEVAGVGRFMRSRSAAKIDAVPTEGPAKRNQLLSHAIGELETIAIVSAPSTANVGEMRVYAECRRVLDTIRLDAQTWVVSARRRVQADRAALELLGPDALSTFEAGGQVLEDLRHAVVSLQSGSAANAALLARNALIAMGRLYDGPQQYTSTDGKLHKATGERNPLHALVDQLFVRSTDEERKRLLIATHDDIDRAYKLGSKAKEPGTIAHAEGIEAVTRTFRIARAVALAAGFPLSNS